MKYKNSDIFNIMQEVTCDFCADDQKIKLREQHPRKWPYMINDLAYIETPKTMCVWVYGVEGGASICLKHLAYLLEELNKAEVERILT